MDTLSIRMDVAVKTYDHTEYGRSLNNCHDYWQHNVCQKPSIKIDFGAFFAWVKDTYGLTCISREGRIVIVSNRDEDWIRFWLEWG